MKKSLLTMAAVMASAACMAQTGVKAEKVNIHSLPVLAEKMTMAPEAQNMVMKSYATGNYYTRPAGSMYYGFTPEGAGYWATMLSLTPFVDGTFTNKNANPSSAKWTINGQDASDLADANNNLVWQIAPGQYYAPTLTKGSDSYTLPNRLDETGQYGVGILGGIPDPTRSTISYLTYTDSHVGIQTYGYTTQADNKFLFGSGVMTSSDGTSYQRVGFSQKFEKPMSPLYVENIFMPIVCGKNQQTPIPNNAKLTLTVTGEDGNVIAQMTAGKDDIVQDMSEGKPVTEDARQFMGFIVYFYTATFAQKELDPVSQQYVSKPFVIDQPFTVTLTGCDAEGIEVGFCGFRCAAEDNLEAGKSLMYPVGGSKDDIVTMSFQPKDNANMAVPMTFTGLLDNAMVAKDLSAQDGTTLSDCNVIRVSDDGTTNTFEKNPNVQTTGVFVYTATPWNDANGNEAYSYEVKESSDGTGDWITGVTVDDSQYKTSTGYTGLNILTFNADAVATGAGNWAVVYIKGRGVTSSDPVILLQGTAKLSDVPTTGIAGTVVDKTAKANNAIYNLNGQRVSKDFKGVLIQNGKKFVNK